MVGLIVDSFLVLMKCSSPGLAFSLLLPTFVFAWRLAFEQQALVCLHVTETGKPGPGMGQELSPGAGRRSAL